MKEIRIGLFGNNGHQLQKDHVLPLTRAKVTAACGIEPSELSGIPDVRFYPDYNSLLADPEIDLVSICAPVRSLQSEAILLALKSGKHVYAEKPAVMSAVELDKILTAAKVLNREFFEMSGTSYEEPYKSAKKIIQSGVLGLIVQIIVQKSYPYAGWRPQHEDMDGGNIMQVGIHAVRMIEHTAGQKVTSVSAIETGLGNPKQGGLQMASVWNLTLSNGGVASITTNYLNQPSFGTWGNESLRVYGVKGFLETEPVQKIIRLVTKDEQKTIETGPSDNYLQAVVNYLLGIASRPFTPEEEFHPLKVVIAAKQSALNNGIFISV